MTELVSGDASGEIRIWDVPSRKTLRILSGHRWATRGVCVSKDGKLVVSCGDDATVRLWTLPKAQMGDMSDPTRKIPKVTTTAVTELLCLKLDEDAFGDHLEKVKHGLARELAGRHV